MDAVSSLFTDEELRGDAGSAFRAATIAVMAHTGECFTTMVKIIAEKYGHPVEEMIAAVKADDRWTSMVLSPIVDKLTSVPAATEAALPAAKKVVKRIKKKPSAAGAANLNEEKG